MVDCDVIVVGFIHMLACGIPASSTCMEEGCWRNFILNCLVAGGEIKCPPATKMNT
jgi:hypothetical protein